MNIIYDILFRTKLSHEYYNSGFSDDFEIVPTPSCQAMMNAFGFLFRKEKYGFVVLAKIKPKVIGLAPELFNSIGGKTLRFSFEMRLRNVYFNNITDLPSFNVGSEVFYFSNLHNVFNGNPSLGDQIAGSLIGSPMSLISGYTQNLKFGHPLNSAGIEIKDIFQNLKIPVDQLALSGNDESADFQIDFRKVKNLSPGRYTTHWSGNGSLGLDTGKADFILEPKIKRDNTFGIIEIFNNTTDIPNNTNVPATHRFLNGNTLVRSGANNDQLTAEYHIRFSAHQPSFWQYIISVSKKSSSVVSLASLVINSFTDISTLDDTNAQRKVFRSDNKIKLLEEVAEKTMTTSPPSTYAPIMPQPNMSSNFKEIKSPDPFYELYYYV